MSIPGRSMPPGHRAMGNRRICPAASAPTLLPPVPISRGILFSHRFKYFSTPCYLLIQMEIAFDMCSWRLGAPGERTDKAKLILINSDQFQREEIGRNGAQWPSVGVRASESFL